MAELRAIKRKAYSVLSQLRIINPSLDDLIHLAEELGFLVLDYSRSSSASSAELLIEELGLTSFAKAGNSFVYKNDDVKLIFLNETLTANEKRYSLAHELGHIYCGHLKNGACCTDADLEEEHDANEFAHYLLHPSFIVRALVFFCSHRIATIIVALAILLGFVSVLITKHVQLTQSYYGEYYITETGHKYHTSDCPMVKDKTNNHRLKIKEYESGKYEPCQICLQDEVD